MAYYFVKAETKPSQRLASFGIVGLYARIAYNKRTALSLLAAYPLLVLPYYHVLLPRQLVFLFLDSWMLLVSLRRELAGYRRYFPLSANFL